jgi:hypothetical protein
LSDIKSLVFFILNSFALGSLGISRLDFGVLSLISKTPGADYIKQFWPLALINVIVKLVSKAYAMQLSPIEHETISQTQTTFIKGTFIHDRALARVHSFMMGL